MNIKENDVIKIDKYYDKIFWGVIIFFGLIQIWMISGMDIYQLGDALQDNVLMVDYAESLCRGEWLGDYNNNTLLKRISYPVFLAVCYKLHLSYLTVLGIFWVLSVVVLVLALKKSIKSRIGLAFIYIFVLFNPVMYNSNYAQVIYRNAIIPPAVILSVALLIGLYARRNESKEIIAIWSAFSGLAFAFFWNIREDSIWLLPFYSGALIITAISIIIETKGKLEILKKLMLLLLSVFCFVDINVSIKFCNYINYEMYTDSELFHSNYAKLQDLLTQIEEVEEVEGVIVHKKTVEKLYEISPAFAELEPYMGEYMYGTFWQVLGDDIDDGEVYSGYFFWGLRDVVQAAGFYTDAKTADRFYEDVYNDIMQAVEKGDIRLKDKKFMILGLDIFGEDADLMIEKTIENIKDMVSYNKLGYVTTTSIGNQQNLRRTEIITNNTIIYKRQNNYLDGWIVPNDDNDDIRLGIYDQNGQIVFDIGLLDSQDVYDYYENNNIIRNKANRARFFYKSESTDMLYMYIFINNELKEKIPLDNSYMGLIEDKDYEMYINSASYEILEDPPVEIDNRKERKYNLVIECHKITGNFFTAMAVCSIVLLFADCVQAWIRKKTNKFEILLILIGIICSYIALVYGVSAQYYAAADGSKMWGYLAGTCPLQGIFVSVSLVVCIEQIIERVCEWKAKKGNGDIL